MEEKNYLNCMMDIESWEKLQNSISEATGMSIVTVDYRGIPITSHSGCSEFCKRVRNDEKLRSYCQKCDARGSLEGVIAQKPFIYRCHFSIVDIAIPIIVDGNYLGAVMAGQVQVQESDKTLKLEQILFINDAELQRKRNELKEYYEQIPTYTGEQLEHTVTMLYHLCDYFVKEPLIKEKTKIPDRKTCPEDKRANMPMVSNRIIAKAIDYIYSTKNQMVSLTEIARYCHVSSPYFSRLFTKEMGEPYSVFVTRLKITLAKEILQSTDMTVMEISDKLGFSEPGYFIKIFKKLTKETPMNYRIHRKNEKSWSWYINSSSLNEKVPQIDQLN